ncbi:MAG: hypothetical protein MZV49_01290 [Rhodopseudomonas palustris]|nr:hypothetical protein [Rhodopseudomonas palustris]
MRLRQVVLLIAEGQADGDLAAYSGQVRGLLRQPEACRRVLAEANAIGAVGALGYGDAIKLGCCASIRPASASAARFQMEPQRADRRRRRGHRHDHRPERRRGWGHQLG